MFRQASTEKTVAGESWDGHGSAAGWWLSSAGGRLVSDGVVARRDSVSSELGITEEGSPGEAVAAACVSTSAGVAGGVVAGMIV